MPKLSHEEQLRISKINEAVAILKEVGLELHGFDPGVSAYIVEKPNAKGNGYWGEPVHFSRIEWQFFKPLFEELIALRKKVAKNDN